MQNFDSISDIHVDRFKSTKVVVNEDQGVHHLHYKNSSLRPSGQKHIHDLFTIIMLQWTELMSRVTSKQDQQTNIVRRETSTRKEKKVSDKFPGGEGDFWSIACVTFTVSTSQSILCSSRRISPNTTEVD